MTRTLRTAVQFFQFIPRRIGRVGREVLTGSAFRPAVQDHAFDAAHGTETAKIEKVYTLDWVSRSYLHSSGYEASLTWEFTNLVSSVSIEREKFCFIDVGCGKARTLIRAKELGFADVSGVELSPFLAGIARKNLDICKISAVVHCMDAAEFEFPSVPVVIYFYNPFAAAVMEKVVEKISQRRLRSSEPIWIVYYHAAHRRLFDGCAWCETASEFPYGVTYRVRPLSA